MKLIQTRQPSANGDSAKSSRRNRPRQATTDTVWWAIAFAIAVAAALIGGGVILWTIFLDSRSPAAMSLGATLLLFGFATAISCLGGWLATGRDSRRRRES